MLNTMEQLILSQQMIPPGSTILCAVSGGADSTCLLHALYRLREKLGFTLIAAHYNHKLRGTESDGDEAFVRQFVELCCGQEILPNGTVLPPVTLYCAFGDVQGESRRRGTGLEETAREMRYAFLRQTARETGAQFIATAHNADDNGETILFHLARGTGLRGLTGIQPKSGDLIRPLLTTPRKEVEAYLAYHSLPHREDGSNRDTAYSRNKIRHQVVPVLESMFPGFAGRVSETAALLRADEAYLTRQAYILSDQAKPQGNGLSISAPLLADAPPPLATRAIRQLIGRLNGGDQDCGLTHLESVLTLCRTTDPSARINLPRGLIARREYESLILTREQLPIEWAEMTLPTPGHCMAGSWSISCYAEIYADQPQTPWSFWLKADKPLIVRPRRTGDQMQLPGRPQKTIKKWYIDEKIPAHLRPTLPVFLQDGQLAAAAGLGPGQCALPTQEQPAWHIIVEALS